MPNRWLIALAGVVMQVALGAVYAWSVFRIPLTQAYGWSIAEVTLAFTIAIFVLGFAAFGGGLWMQRVGPRRVALAHAHSMGWASSSPALQATGSGCSTAPTD